MSSLLSICVAKYSFCFLRVHSLKDEQSFLILMSKSFVDSIPIAVSVLLYPVQEVFSYSEVVKVFLYIIFYYRIFSVLSPQVYIYN